MVKKIEVVTSREGELTTLYAVKEDNTWEMIGNFATKEEAERAKKFYEKEWGLAKEGTMEKHLNPNKEISAEEWYKKYYLQKVPCPKFIEEHRAFLIAPGIIHCPGCDMLSDIKASYHLLEIYKKLSDVQREWRVLKGRHLK